MKEWLPLLQAWMEDAQRLFDIHREAWIALGMPDVDALRLVRPDSVGVARLLSLRDSGLDPEILSFYSTTDGWPLWLGSFLCKVVRSREVGAFPDVYPDAFEIAMSSAPHRRTVSATSTDLSVDDLRTALVLSAPDAREIVLAFETGETCLYFFDGMQLFVDFYSFMEHRGNEIRDWLSEMLASREGEAAV